MDNPSPRVAEHEEDEEHRLGPDDGQRPSPTGPNPRQEYPEDAIELTKARLPRTSLENDKLVAQGQILDG
jgi:hypothetical protein